MCFRPNSMSTEDGGSRYVTCQTCGMAVDDDPNVTGGYCPYCGDPIPSTLPDDFSEIDPSYSTRII